MAEIEATIGNFVRATGDGAGPHLPPIDGPRALLKAQMSALSQASPTNASRVLGIANLRFASTVALAIVAAIAAVILSHGVLLHRAPNASSSAVASLPDRTLTPGSARPVALAQLCSSRHEEVVRTVPTPLQQQVFQEYGLAGVRAADYEVDYLITPGLGGSDDVKNLWPEPHSDTAWNSYVKDQLENHLHDLVCGGQVDLSTAQRDISSDWVAAYKKYFHTDKPLPLRVQSS